jgi:hypothetical protein
MFCAVLVEVPISWRSDVVQKPPFDDVLLGFGFIFVLALAHLLLFQFYSRSMVLLNEFLDLFLLHVPAKSFKKN